MKPLINIETDKCVLSDGEINSLILRQKNIKWPQSLLLDALITNDQVTLDEYRDYLKNKIAPFIINETAKREKLAKVIEYETAVKTIKYIPEKIIKNEIKIDNPDYIKYEQIIVDSTEEIRKLASLRKK